MNEQRTPGTPVEFGIPGQDRHREPFGERKVGRVIGGRIAGQLDHPREQRAHRPDVERSRREPPNRFGEGSPIQLSSEPGATERAGHLDGEVLGHRPVWIGRGIRAVLVSASESGDQVREDGRVHDDHSVSRAARCDRRRSRRVASRPDQLHEVNIIRPLERLLGPRPPASADSPDRPPPAPADRGGRPATTAPAPERQRPADLAPVRERRESAMQPCMYFNMHQLRLVRSSARYSELRI